MVRSPFFHNSCNLCTVIEVARPPVSCKDIPLAHCLNLLSFSMNIQNSVVPGLLQTFGNFLQFGNE